MPARHDWVANCYASCEVYAGMHSQCVKDAPMTPISGNLTLHVPPVDEDCVKEATTGCHHDGWKIPTNTAKFIHLIATLKNFFNCNGVDAAFQRHISPMHEDHMENTCR